MKYTIYTDGACSGNPGNGGYAFLITVGEKIILKVSGYKKDTTNNNMELTAIVKGLKHVFDGSSLKNTEVEVLSDSAYCVNSVNQGWVFFWEKNKWKTKSGEEVKNKELWKELVEILSKNKNIKFEKVKGHSGNKFNEIVDKEAKDAIKRLKQEASHESDN